MSGFTCKATAWNVDLHFLALKIQECLNEGLDDDETAICNHVRYWVSNVQKVDATYSRMTLLWTVNFVTHDGSGKEYHYKFFVKSNS